MGYDYGTNNNGQIQAVHYYTSPGVEDSRGSEYFSYDPWLRLSAAHTGTVSQNTPYTWSLQWGYDRFGNRLSQTLVDGNVSIGQPLFSVDPATNRITNTGYSYDAAGNMTNDSVNAYSYDGANRLTQINGGSVTYTYFGASRIKKVVGTTTTVYIYSGRKPIVEYVNGSSTPSQEYIYAGSQLLVTLSGTNTTYHHPDYLSNRAETDANGNTVRNFGHFPFGETWYETAADKLKFTTYENDSATGETGLNYAQFRYHAPGLGRFMSADLWIGSMNAPQSLNRYAYAMDDPVNLVDPLGLECTLAFVFHVIGGVPSQGQWFLYGHCGNTGGGGIDYAQLLDGGGGGGAPGNPPKKKCKDLSLNDPSVFWDGTFATPDQVQAYFTNQGVTWDGKATGDEFSAADLNPGLAVGIINAETSFGNSPRGLTARNERDPFSTGGKNFGNSLTRAVDTINKLEEHTFTDNQPLSALVNRQNDAAGYRHGRAQGQAYDTTQIGQWLNNVQNGFRDFARFLGLCE